ncbi:single-stranded-DNA-specific exonuclease RecJ [Halovivax gelatinilyticus]|uniref:single-stranded-DNA-specific exonuclease RecJ n=1 Tax=Halovivax gelatinilyticus TaxID=2961597 RepID=UPI0020CA8B2D|nr:DHH family phosphoesterase [Halovivax gelatinilyticus]
MVEVPVEPEWVEPEFDPGTVESLAESLDCSSVLASVLVSRGYTDPVEAERALDPAVEAIHSPAQLPDIDAIVSRLDAAVERDEFVAVFSDRDVDGITGSAILTSVFEDLGVSPVSRAPEKWDGYGVSEEHVAELVSEGVELLVLVDCGTTAHDPIDQAIDAGMDVVVIDHHDPEATLPAASACVNPRRADSEYPNLDLAAGALAWKVGQAFVEARAPLRIAEYHEMALPLAAVATLGDYMPLTVENRAIVREGFSRLSESDLPGLDQTVDHCGVESMRDIGWSLVPLLNAAQEAESGELMLELLLAEDAGEIEELIDRLEGYRADRRRQRAERLAHLEACIDEQLDPSSVDVVFVETDQYVGGGPMSEVSSRWQRPVITYRRSDTGYRGGGRTAPDIDLLELYEACDELLETYWGHPGAAGFRVSEANLAPFKRRLTETLRTRYDPADLRPSIDVDATVEPTTLTPGLVEDFDRFGPYGSGHDEPIVLIENVDIVSAEWFGSDDSHWKGIPGQGAGVTFIDWNGDVVESVGFPSGACDIAGTLSIDSFDGSVTVSVKAIRSASGETGPV